LAIDTLAEQILHLPDAAGVYLMKNVAGDIIYVGKASSLKKRVSSYFTGNKDLKTRVLVENITSIETIATRNAYEALVLENNLIKKWQPRYNINLKDGKSYPVIRITREAFPRVFRTRRVINDGSEYYGPFPSVHRLDAYLELIEQLFPLRKCKGKLKKREHPCLYYHIHRCSAPCAGLIDKEEYGKTVDSIRKLLSGQVDPLIRDLTSSMKQAAGKLEFENAAGYRDAIATLRAINEDQEVQDFDTGDRDYIAAVEREQMCTFVVFQMREGKLLGRDLFRTENYGRTEEAMQQFIFQYYGGAGAAAKNPPDKLYVSELLDTDLIRTYLERERGKSAEVKVPKRGRHVSILAMARENGLLDLDARMRNRRNTEAIEELKVVLDLTVPPRRIEGFDISQLSGKHPVASMVSFFDGIPDKANYRKFLIKTLDGKIDDYEAMREVIARRYTRIVNEKLEVPDLILVDGGKGQVNAAVGIISALGLERIAIAGLAKREEEIFLPGRSEPCRLPETSPGLKVLQRVRDESHRFATTFNKSLRKKGLKLTTYTDIPGIGDVRSKKLLLAFGSRANAAQAAPAELAKVLNIGLEKAKEFSDRLKEHSQ
jgi:excinuclease ABC subunit C